MTTILDATKTLRSSLEAIYDSREAMNIAGLVMEHVTGLSRVDRITQKDKPLSEQQLKNLTIFSRQLSEHRPVQYVLNEAWFAGMRFYVDEHVLIPRPETEELVDWVLQDIKPGLTILDIGTGSGCIPIALKKKAPGSDLYACDISNEALSIAARNARSNETVIEFIRQDILLPHPLMAEGVQMDVIISNPPYIPEAEKIEIAEHVKAYEPDIALFVSDDDPLIFYKAIARYAIGKLKPTGRLYFEIHQDMAEKVTDMVRSNGISNIEIRKDLQGNDRMIRASF